MKELRERVEKFYGEVLNCHVAQTTCNFIMQNRDRLSTEAVVQWCRFVAVCCRTVECVEASDECVAAVGCLLVGDVDGYLKHCEAAQQLHAKRVTLAQAAQMPFMKPVPEEMRRL